MQLELTTFAAGRSHNWCRCPLMREFAMGYPCPTNQGPLAVPAEIFNA
jgi:hypothetical protein